MRVDLENETSGYIEEGWMTIEIEIKLFDEREFDKETAYIPKPLDLVPCTWSEPDCDKRIREGILVTRVIPL